MPTFTRKTSTAHRENSRLVTALIHWRCSAQDDTVVVRRSRHCYAMPPSLGSGSIGEFTSLLSDDTLFFGFALFFGNDTLFFGFMRLSFDCATRSFKFSPQKATLFESLPPWGKVACEARRMRGRTLSVRLSWLLILHFLTRNCFCLPPWGRWHGLP